VSRKLWRAPAKVNLTLRVLARRADGYHELESLVAFAGACDWLEFEPGGPLSLEVMGPTAPSAGPMDDNLVLRAARALAETVPGLRLGHFRLFKALPVAAGLGGGSSDAAAALRALANANNMGADDLRIWAAARATGADVPVCLDPRARMMRGVGELIGPALGMAPLPTVLVNPGVAVPTPQVFAGLGLARGEIHGRADAREIDLADMFAALATGRNDLQPIAEVIAPQIREARDLLKASQGVRLARMSGSGATCFALFANRHRAAHAARALRALRPAWWVRATYLG